MNFIHLLLLFLKKIESYICGSHCVSVGRCWSRRCYLWAKRGLQDERRGQVTTDAGADLTGDTTGQTLRAPGAQGPRQGNVSRITPLTLDFTRPSELGLGSPELVSVDAL